MLELTPLDFIDIGKGKGCNVSYAVFMLIWAAILFFDKEIGMGMLVLAAWVVPAIIDYIFPGFANSLFMRVIYAIILITGMVLALTWMYKIVMQ